MFPATLDNAEVLFYTPADNYGSICCPDGSCVHYFRYLAICRYSNSEDYYLFCCDAEFEVVCDSVWSNIDECKKIAEQYKKDISWVSAQ